MTDLIITKTLTIPEAELSWRFGPSGGPGGQHANRAHSRVELRFNIADSAVLNDTQRRSLTAAVGPVAHVIVDDTRSQHRNREIARHRLSRRLADALQPVAARRKTKPSRGSVERRLAAKRRRSQSKSQRRRPDNDW